MGVTLVPALTSFLLGKEGDDYYGVPNVGGKSFSRLSRLGSLSHGDVIRMENLTALGYFRNLDIED